MQKKPPESHIHPPPPRPDANPLLNTTIPVDLSNYYAEIIQKLAQQQVDNLHATDPQSNYPTEENTSIDEDDDDAPTLYHIGPIAPFDASSQQPHTLEQPSPLEHAPTHHLSPPTDATHAHNPYALHNPRLTLEYIAYNDNIVAAVPSSHEHPTPHQATHTHPPSHHETDLQHTTHNDQDNNTYTPHPPNPDTYASYPSYDAHNAHASQPDDDNNNAYISQNPDPHSHARTSQTPDPDYNAHALHAPSPGLLRMTTDPSLMPFLTPTSPHPLPVLHPSPPQEPDLPSSPYAEPNALFAQHAQAEDGKDDEDNDEEDTDSLFGMSTMGGYLAKLFGMGKIGEFLRNLAFFSGMGRTSLMRLSQKVSVQKFDANEVIMRRGQEGESMFILAQGDVQVLLRGGAGEAMRIIPLRVGDVFGEMGLLTGNPRSADVVSISKSVCLELQKRDVETLCAQHPPMARFLTAILGQRLRSSKAITNVGKIHILREIGAGTTAFVYAAQHQDTQQPVALKMLSHELAYDQAFRKRFLDEALILSQLQHPHIVRLYGIEEAYATVFLIMEMVEGSDLDSLLEKHTRFSCDAVRRILYQAASALHHAHEHGIVHRDVKPANLLMNHRGHVKVSDFGLAVQPSKDKEVQSAQKPEGSPSYMAPEQIMWQPVDHRADIYALGITAFKMLTGVLPFQGSIEHIFQQHVTTPLPSLHAYDPSIPPDFVALVQKATAKAKEDRFPSLREFLSALS